MSYSTSEFVPPPPEFTQFAGQLASTRKLKLADSKVNIHKIDFDNSNAAKFRRVASTAKIQYDDKRPIIQNVIIIVIAFFAMILGTFWRPSLCVDDDSDDSNGIDETQCFLAFFSNSTLDSFVFLNIMIIGVAIYLIYCQRATNEVQHARSLKAYVVSGDTKRRVIIFIETLLLYSMHSIIISSEYRGVKGMLFLFCLIMITLMGIMTVTKRYKLLMKVPVKSPETWSKTYMTSVVMTIFVQFVMTLHAISVSSKQNLIIYSFVGLSYLWIFWSQLYHSEIVLFVNELNEIPSLKMSGDEVKDERLIKSVEMEAETAKRRHFPTTFGALVLLNELVMASTFLVFIICCAMGSGRYDGATGNGDKFCVAVYLLIAMAMFINSCVAHLAMQSMNQLQKRYKAQAFQPLLKESLLAKSP